jgi:hypothetical protein
MLYKLRHSDGIIEFVRNRGRVLLEADDADAALRAARDLFSQTRQEKARPLGSGQYLVTFRVSLDYRLPLLRTVEKAVRLMRTRKLYDEGRYLDRYIVATICRNTGKPEFLADLDIRQEISTLRKSAVVAREVQNVIGFVEWDICIHNYIELNSKEGYKSRVVRKVSD